MFFQTYDQHRHTADHVSQYWYNEDITFLILLFWNLINLQHDYDGELCKRCSRHDLMEKIIKTELFFGKFCPSLMRNIDNSKNMQFKNMQLIFFPNRWLSYQNQTISSDQRLIWNKGCKTQLVASCTTPILFTPQLSGSTFVLKSLTALLICPNKTANK